MLVTPRGCLIDGHMSCAQFLVLKTFLVFSPLEDAIANSLIPAIMGREISAIEREVIKLPVRFGGL